MRQLDIDLNNASKGLPHLHIENLYELLHAALLEAFEGAGQTASWIIPGRQQAETQQTSALFLQAPPPIAQQLVSAQCIDPQTHERVLRHAA